MPASALQARDDLSVRVVSAAHPSIPSAAIMRLGKHLSTGSDQRQACGRLWMSLADPTLMGVSGLTKEGAASPPSSNGEAVLPSGGEAVLPSGGEAVLPLMSANLGGEGGTLPFCLQLRGRGQRHLLAPSTRSGILEGGHWGCVSDTVTCSG